ncbi:hypothetical protein PMG11_09260 [Penicillium brasilianum]|uniref:Uncharacterized protein n=1 Tax=Penicillium brasilianum TaxID=104259 RepID=A0A0F7TXN6_PENBI|nr:hypothetical protein PMG11_09260 [Penicillium brasilianum]
MLLLLIQGGISPLQDPISKYIPEIKAAADDLLPNATKINDGIDYTKWNEITVGELASHLADIARDYGVFDLTEQASLLQSLGFPALPLAQIPSCGVPKPCSRMQFFDGLLKSHPIVPASSTPIYSNAAFQVLRTVVETFSNGEDFEKVLKEKIIKPLSMAHTFHTTPNPSLGVIPSYQGEYWWNFDIGEKAPAGGIFSSTKDMSTFGRAILNSSLLPRSTTRRWLKPLARTSSIDYAVGAPWEILSFGNERPIDLYTKSGDIGTYSSGFVLLGAGNNTHVSLALASDLVSESLLPALEQAAKNQAHTRFAGTYALGTVNSSITITTDDGLALVITSWVNNGTNMFRSYMALSGIADPSMLSIRLYPTRLENPGQLSFRAVIPPPLPSGIGPFSSSCISWVTVNAQVYGNVGIDEFVFHLDRKGNAVSVSPRVLRTVLLKTK